MRLYWRRPHAVDLTIDQETGIAGLDIVPCLDACGRRPIGRTRRTFGTADNSHQDYSKSREFPLAFLRVNNHPDLLVAYMCHRLRARATVL